MRSVAVAAVVVVSELLYGREFKCTNRRGKDGSRCWLGGRVVGYHERLVDLRSPLSDDSRF